MIAGTFPKRIAGWGELHKRRYGSGFIGTLCTAVGVVALCLMGFAIYSKVIAMRRDRAVQEMLEQRKLVRRVQTNRTATAASVAKTGPGFFLDIGYSADGLVASQVTKHLESKGWRGVCAAPFAYDLSGSGRTCEFVGQHVSAKTGQRDSVLQCIQTLWATNCDDVEVESVGIEDFLVNTRAPKVIDYASLRTQGSELDILKNFPFSKHCVRAWSINHDYEANKMMEIQHLLEVAQGCRVRDGGPEFWARCPCDRRQV